jgi:hypothetical protein
VAEERSAGVGEADAAGGAVHQLGPCLALERGDLLGDRGLRVAQRLGRSGERAALGNLLQHPQVLQIEHNGILSLSILIRI